MFLLRPLIYVNENDTREWAKNRFPIIDCSCEVCEIPNQERQKIKRLIQGLEKENSGVPNSILRSMAHVNASHLLDNRIYDFDKIDDFQKS